MCPPTYTQLLHIFPVLIAFYPNLDPQKDTGKQMLYFYIHCFTPLALYVTWNYM